MQINLKSKQQIYLEIHDSIARYIALGVLSHGEKLPSVRNLASELGINPNTVERAYNLLEAEGKIIVLPQKGAYVVGLDQQAESPVLTPSPKIILQKVLKLRSEGVSKEELLIAIDKAYKEND